MGLKQFAHFTTLVLILLGTIGRAAPTQNPSIPHIDLNPIHSEAFSDRTNWKQRLSISYGYTVGPINNASVSEQAGLYKFILQDHPKNFDPWEYGILISTTPYFGVEIGKKFFFILGDTFRPFYKYTFGSFFSANEQLGTFIHWDRYFIGASIGSEYLLSNDSLLRFDLHAAYSLIGLRYDYTFGYGWTY